MKSKADQLDYHAPQISFFGDVRDLTQKRIGVTDNNKSKGPNHMSG
jgi:hypothetical protein